MKYVRPFLLLFVGFFSLVVVLAIQGDEQGYFGERESLMSEQSHRGSRRWVAPLMRKSTPVEEYLIVKFLCSLGGVFMFSYFVWTNDGLQDTFLDLPSNEGKGGRLYKEDGVFLEESPFEGFNDFHKKRSDDKKGDSLSLDVRLPISRKDSDCSFNRDSGNDLSFLEKEEGIEALHLFNNKKLLLTVLDNQIVVYSIATASVLMKVVGVKVVKLSCSRNTSHFAVVTAGKNSEALRLYTANNTEGKVLIKSAPSIGQLSFGFDYNKGWGCFLAIVDYKLKSWRFTEKGVQTEDISITFEDNREYINGCVDFYMAVFSPGMKWLFVQFCANLKCTAVICKVKVEEEGLVASNYLYFSYWLEEATFSDNGTYFSFINEHNELQRWALEGVGKPYLYREKLDEGCNVKLSPAGFFSWEKKPSGLLKVWPRYPRNGAYRWSVTFSEPPSSICLLDKKLYATFAGMVKRYDIGWQYKDYSKNLLGEKDDEKENFVEEIDDEKYDFEDEEVYEITF